MVNLLIEAGADLDATRHDAPESDRRSALHEACKEGHTACAMRLIKAGAATGGVDIWGLTPRGLAEQKGHSLLAELLRKAGAGLAD